MIIEYKNISLRRFSEFTVQTYEIDCVKMRNSSEKGTVPKGSRIRKEELKSQRDNIQGFIL